MPSDLQKRFMEEMETLYKYPGHDTDDINHPPHYNHGRIEVIEAILDWKLPYCLGAAVKYIGRHAHKGEPLADLKKARWYINKEIERIENGKRNDSACNCD